MPEPTNSPETAETQGAETRRPTPDQLAEVAKLLSGDEPEEHDDQGEPRGDDQGDEPDSSEEAEGKPETDEKPKPTTLKDLAERTGITLEELYALEVPHGNGESRTLGELKDLSAKVSSLDVDRLTFEEEKTAKEREFLRASTELNTLIGMLPKSAISDELLENVARTRQKSEEREEAATLRTIPAWKDGDIRSRDEDAMDSLLVEYGLPKGYLDNILDHRVRAFIRDATLRKQRIDAALQEVRKRQKPGHSPSSRPSKPSKKTKGARRAVSSQNQVSQVAELLRNG